MSYPKGIQRFGNVRKVGTVRWLMRLGLLLAAMVLTAGCGTGSGEEPESLEPGHISPGTNPGTTPEVVTGDPIAFSARQQEDQDVTRAEAPLESKVESFIVYGYKNKGSDFSSIQTVFPGYVVKWKGNANSSTTNTDGWEYLNQQPIGEEEQTIKYWDMSATAYRFFGVAKDEGDYSAKEILDGGLPKEYKISFVVDATTEAGVKAVPYISTLWFSTGTQDYPDRQFSKPVKLFFQKPFARVRFKFTQSYPDAVLMLEDKRFFPNNPVQQKIVDKCQLTITYPLKGDDKVETYERSDEAGIVAFTEDYSDTNQRWYNVYAPQSLGAFTLSVKVNGAVKTVDVPAEYMDWLPGYQYTYVFKITDQGGIEIDLVESAFSKWYDMTGSTTVYNW